MKNIKILIFVQYILEINKLMDELNRKFILDKLKESSVFSDLISIEEYAEENHIPIMKKDTAEFIYLLTKIKKPLKILEIGTAIGYSGIIMLKAFDKSMLTTIEINNNNYETAKNNFAEFNLSDRVIMHLGDCMDILPLMEGQYDFIFLDGPKGQYPVLFNYCEKLLSKNGIIICDNVLYSGYISGERSEIRKHRTIIKNMRNFIDERFCDKKYDTDLLEVGDGLLVAYKKD